MIIAFYPGAGGNRYLQMLKKQDWKQLQRSYDQDVKGQQFKYRYLLDSTSSRVVRNRDNYVLTHSANSQLIETYFPSEPIVFIRADLQKCLRREWVLAGHDRFKGKNIEKVIDRLQHYASYKDKEWPVVNTVEELESLPFAILSETNLDFEKITKPKSNGPQNLQSLIDELVTKAESSYQAVKWHLEYYKMYPVDFSKNCEKIIDVDNDDSEFAEVMRSELELYKSDIFDQTWKIANDET